MVLAQSLNEAAPIYNLVLVLVVFFLFYHLFTLPKNLHVFIKPWIFLLIGVVIFVAEEILTIIRDYYGWDKSTFGILFGVFELGMISMFIYMILIEKEHIEEKKRQETKVFRP